MLWWFRYKVSRRKVEKRVIIFQVRLNIGYLGGFHNLNDYGKVRCYMRVKVIDFAYFCDWSFGLWNSSEIAVPFYFSLYCSINGMLLQTCIWFRTQPGLYDHRIRNSWMGDMSRLRIPFSPKFRYSEISTVQIPIVRRPISPKNITFCFLLESSRSHHLLSSLWHW